MSKIGIRSEATMRGKVVNETNGRRHRESGRAPAVTALGATLLVLTSGTLACSTGPEQGPATTTHEKIVNGDPLTAAQAKIDPTVNVITRGSGTLLNSKTVLTAAHLFIQEIAFNAPPRSPFKVEHGIDGTDGKALVQGFPDIATNFSVRRQVNTDPKTGKTVTRLFPVGTDLAIAHLQTTLGKTVAFPLVDCDPNRAPARVRVASAWHATGGILDQFRNVPQAPGLINQATFKVNDAGVEKISWFGNFDNPFNFQATVFGDSGGGVYDADDDSITNRLMGVDVDGVDATSVLARVFIGRIGHGVRFSYKDTDFDVCRWVNEHMVDPGPTGTLLAADFDNDGVPDDVSLRQIAGTSYVLDVNISSIGDQTFPVDFPGLGDLRSGVVGDFTGGGLSLAVTDGPGIRTGSFNDGPEPSVSTASALVANTALLVGGTDTEYLTLAATRLDGDKFEDLVAMRADLGFDVFRGGSSGLVLDPTIKPVPFKLDADQIPDYVWLDGGAGIHTSSSRLAHTATGKNGHTFRKVVPDTLQLTSVGAGHFRNVTGENEGIEDIVTLGGGFVIWCTSNTFGAVECKPGLDGPPARHATNFNVEDINADGLDDLRVFYSDATPRIFLGQNDGFASSFGYGVRDAVGLDLNGDNQQDTITIDSSGGNVALKVRLGPQGAGDFGPFVTDVPFTDPVSLAIGNFNGDTAPAAFKLGGNTALDATGFPLQDIAILSGGRVFALVSNGDGTLTTTEVPGDDYVSIEVGDFNGDGADDLEATREDGSVSEFPGVAGSSDGIDATGDNFTGLPTPDSDDGKMLLLSGLGVDTVGATEARFRISVAEDADSAALDHLTVQIFDGDNGGLNQFDKETKVLKTCYRLSADPCGDGNAGSCSGGSTTPTEIVTLSSDSFGDNVWDNLYQGPHSPAASIAGDGNPPYNYQLRVYMSNDCSVLPSPGDTIAVATADAFKVRANGLLSMPAGEFSLVGSDSSGDFGVSGQSYMTDTNYDGVFELPIAVGSSATEIQLKESDADDTTDSTPGVSLGANADIQYRLVDPNGNDATLVGAEDTSGTTLVTNPSGNNDGVHDLDVETRIHTITSPGSGTWIWRWENVMAANAFHVFTPFGSPTTHEVLGARRARVTVTSAQQPYFWQTDATTLAQALPIVLGHKLSNGTLEGSSVEVTTAAQANGILNNASNTLAAELQRQLLVTKLNQVRAGNKGEDLRGALVYGTTTSVRHTLADADAAVSGSDPFATDDKSRRLVTLLSSVNLGEVTYLQPGVPFPAQPMADLDGDGIVDMKDNCPAVANPLQEDADDNLIGDACNVTPIVDCVLNRTPDTLTAFFDYDNPLSFRSIPLGLRNQVLSSSGTTAFDEPNEFGAGQQAAFSADFASSESLSWSLEGQTVVADGHSTLCSGKELATGGSAPQTTLFGTESVKVGDHVTVRAGTDLPSILSGGEVDVGGDAEVGHVFAGGRALLAAHSAVRGTLVTAQTVQRAGDAAVLGQQRERAVVPDHSIAWWVDFGTSVPAAVELAPNETRKLAPGAYGDVVVPAGAVLTLAAGTYQFASLSVASSAVLSISAGNVVVHVATGLSHHGETRVASDGGLVLGYFGNDEAVIDASLRATVIAPNASVVLGAVRNSVYTGSFFARSIEVRPSSIVEYEAPR